MDDHDRRQKALEFANSAYLARFEDLARQTQEKTKELRGQFAVGGMVRSGFETTSLAKIAAEQVLASVDAKLDALMEGYELYGVTVSDQLAEQILGNLQELHRSLVDSVRRSVSSCPAQIGIGEPHLFMNAIEQYAPFSMIRYKTAIERRRLMKKPRPTVTNVYNLEGHNPHVNINSQDSSINNVVVSSEQVFQDLRSAISGLPETDERKEIIGRLEALEEARSSWSFKERYTEFISAAANHMALIAPFIPALTEMLKKVS